MPPPLLSIRDLTISFANGRASRTTAVADVSLTLYPNQTLAIVGESGSGKSVTALSVLGLLPRQSSHVDRGNISLLARDGATIHLESCADAILRRVRGGEIAMVFQEPMSSLNPVYTVGEQIMEAVLLHRRVANRNQARKIAIESLEAVGISDALRRMNDFPHRFSGGMRQRVMIAMALACRPRILLADEPTTALDVTMQAQILDLLQQVQREHGLGVLLITHDLRVVEQRADVVGVMYAGRIVEYGRTKDIFASPMHPYTRALLQCAPRVRSGEVAADLAANRRLVTIADVVGDSSAAEVRLPGSPAPLRAWWPNHKPPSDAALSEAGFGTTDLIRASNERWVAVWRTKLLPAGSDARTYPDIEPVTDSAAYRNPGPAPCES